jgi:cysteine desulfurase
VIRRRPVYLDHQATTPLDPRVLEAMLPWLMGSFGNASSRQHAFGWEAGSAVAVARETVAEALGAEPREIVFTSGATESNNLALLGAARAARGRGDHVVTSAVEHRAVLDPCRQLAAEGFDVTVLNPDETGRTAVERVEAALTTRTILVSLMAASNGRDSTRWRRSRLSARPGGFSSTRTPPRPSGRCRSPWGRASLSPP